MSLMLPVARDIVARPEAWHVRRDSISVHVNGDYVSANFVLVCEGWLERTADCHLTIMWSEEVDVRKLMEWHQIALKHDVTVVLMNWRQTFHTCPHIFVQNDGAASVPETGNRVLLNLHRDSWLAFKWLQISGKAARFLKVTMRRSTTDSHISVDHTSAL